MEYIENLSTRISDCRPPRTTQYHSPDPWLATSALQKAIRRGDRDFALQAAAYLALAQAERLWRRLVVIALEDVGIADLDLVHAVLWVSGRKVWRRDNGGEERVAAYFVDQLCKAAKCRDACDVLVIADLHPDLRKQRAEFAGLTLNELSDIIAGHDSPLPERVLAAWYVAGTHQFPGAQLQARRGSFRILLEIYEQLGVPAEVRQVAELGSTRTREAHPVSLPLIWQHSTQTEERVIRDEAPQSLGMVGDWPGYALDMHTRSGKRALKLFAERGFNRSDPVVTEIPAHKLEDVISSAVFRIEGAAVDRRLTYEGSDMILQEAEAAHVYTDGMPPSHAQALLALVRERMPLLHRCRELVAGTTR